MLLFDDFIISIANISCICFFTSGFKLSGTRYACNRVGLKSLVTFISWVTIVHNPGLSEKRPGYLFRTDSNSFLCCTDKRFDFYSADRLSIQRTGHDVMWVRVREWQWCVHSPAGYRLRESKLFLMRTKKPYCRFHILSMKVGYIL